MIEKTIRAIERVQALPADGKCCENCRYSTKIEDAPNRLNCVFNPPTVSFAFIVDQRGTGQWPSVSGWPMVQPHQWCAKFDKKLDS